MGLKIRCLTLVCLVAVLLMAMAAPASARVKGEPDLEAAIVGNNEFLPGEKGTLQVMVQNKGMFSGDIEDPDDQVMALGKRTAMGILEVYPCTAAIGLTATLRSPDPALEILTESAILGTLESGQATMQPLTFSFRIAKDAKPGTYQLALESRYQYLGDVDWLNSPEPEPEPENALEIQLYEPEYELGWEEKTEIEYISLRVLGTDFSVVQLGTERIRAGATGVVTVTIMNSGAGEAHEVTAEVVPGGNFIPVDKAAFLGDVPPGKFVTTKFKLSVSEEAIAKVSPLGILIKYKDANDTPRQALLNIGIPVEEKTEFEVRKVDLNSDLNPGGECVLSLLIENTSSHEVKDVVARINAVDPFSSTDDTSYVGTLQANESGTAKFRLKVDRDALPKSYALDVGVKYWDEEGNSYIPKPMKAVVEVSPRSDSRLGSVLLIVVVIGIIGGGAYYLLRRRDLIRSHLRPRKS